MAWFPKSIRPALAENTAVRRSMLGEALDAFGAAAFVFDAAGVVMTANQAAVTLTGYSWEELLQMDSAHLMAEPQLGQERVAAVVAGSLRVGRSSIRTKEGSNVAVDFRVGATTLAGSTGYYLSLCWQASPEPIEPAASRLAAATPAAL
jgi:PAS domain S-box-containing protein